MGMKQTILIIILLLHFLNCETPPDKKPITEHPDWSKHQGEMFWKEANKKCISLKMRLPSEKDLNSVTYKELISSWGENHNPYAQDVQWIWTSVEYGNGVAHYAFNIYDKSYTGYHDEHNLSVRCIR